MWRIEQTQTGGTSGMGFQSMFHRQDADATNGSRRALLSRMRTFVVLVVMAVLGGLFLVQKQHEHQKAASTQPVSAQSASPRPVSEHNWAKHALDTTNKVTRKVAEQRKEDGTR
jgi:hypothetical protein